LPRGFFVGYVPAQKHHKGAGIERIHPGPLEDQLLNSQNFLLFDMEEYGFQSAFFLEFYPSFDQR